MTAFLRWIVDVGLQNEHPSRTSILRPRIPLRTECNLRVEKKGPPSGPSLTLRRFAPEASRDCEFSVDRKGRLGEGLRGPRLLCGRLRPRPLETVKTRWIVRVASGRGLVVLRSLCGGSRRRPLETAKTRWIVRVALGRGFGSLVHSAAYKLRHTNSAI